MSSRSCLQVITVLFSTLAFSSCLMTRSDVGENEQSQVYSKKNADNQYEASVQQAQTQVESQLNQRSGSVAISQVDERDELIRALNGRVESLESQIAEANRDKATTSNQDAQKIELLQEALVKMEAQIKALEAQQIQAKAQAEAAALATKREDPPVMKVVRKNSKESAKPAEKVASEKTSNSYELAQGFFANKEWKKAILNYQKYVDDHPKGKDVSDSKYKIGVCFQELGMKEEAMAFFEEVVANYGKTDAGKKAKIRLTNLKK